MKWRYELLLALAIAALAVALMLVDVYVLPFTNAFR